MFILQKGGSSGLLVSAPGQSTSLIPALLFLSIRMSVLNPVSMQIAGGTQRLAYEKMYLLTTSSMQTEQKLESNMFFKIPIDIDSNKKSKLADTLKR